PLVDRRLGLEREAPDPHPPERGAKRRPLLLHPQLHVSSSSADPIKTDAGEVPERDLPRVRGRASAGGYRSSAGTGSTSSRTTGSIEGRSTCCGSRPSTLIVGSHPSHFGR